MKKYRLLALSISLALYSIVLSAQNVFVEYAKEIPVGDYEFTDCNTSQKRSIHDPLNEGKILMVIKMATWCPHCKSNTKANFTKDTVAALLKKYGKDKLEIWAMYDGPTDCNGARNALSECGLTGADVFFGVDNNDIDSKFLSAGVPTILVIDPKTKRSAFQNWESASDFSGAKRTVVALLNDTYTFPTFGKSDNIVQFKPAKVSSVRNNRLDINGPQYITDGKLGTAWGSELNKAQDAWAVIDLGKPYQITSVEMRIGNSNDSKKIKIQVADAESGPWTTISELTPFNTILKFRITSTQMGRYFRVLNAEANSGWILSLIDLYVKGTSEPTASEDQLLLQSINIYPNPAQDMLYLNTPQKVAYELLSSTGLVANRGIFESGTNELNTKDLTKGLYLLRLSLNGYKTDLKVIKE